VRTSQDTSTTSPATPTGRDATWLVVALVLVTLNLRPAMSAVSALLSAIKADLGLSSAAVSVLTTLPTVGLAVFTFLGPRLTGRWGEERLIAGSVAVLMLGNVVRLVPSTVALFGGTILVGAGIGLVTSAIPGLVKRTFPERFATLMAVYTVTLTIGAAGASGLATPLGTALDSAWTLPLGVLTIPLAVLAVLWWLPKLRTPSQRRTHAVIPAALWRDSLAWQVTVFFATTGFVFYFVLSWLPTVSRDRGMDATASGLVLSVVALVQVIGSLAVPAVLRRTRDQRGLAVAVAVINIVGLTGVILAPVPGWVWVSAVVLGLGQGGGFGLAMTLIGLRARDSATATGLSGMTQGIGYTISAAGPLATGLLHSATGTWSAALVLLVVVCVLQLGSGLGAGRAREVMGTR
jgi:CP family cyanate transporter-like MFS transporter